MAKYSYEVDVVRYRRVTEGVTVTVESSERLTEEELHREADKIIDDFPTGNEWGFQDDDEDGDRDYVVLSGECDIKEE